MRTGERQGSLERPKQIPIKTLSPKAIHQRIISPKASLPKPDFNKAQIGDLEKQVSELKEKLDSSEKEREFFFSKLRTIELYCDHFESQGNQAIIDIQKILFATESEQVSLDDEGIVTFGKIAKDDIS